MYRLRDRRFDLVDVVRIGLSSYCLVLVYIELVTELCYCDYTPSFYESVVKDMVPFFDITDHTASIVVSSGRQVKGHYASMYRRYYRDGDR